MLDKCNYFLGKRALNSHNHNPKHNSLTKKKTHLSPVYGFGKIFLRKNHIKLGKLILAAKNGQGSSKMIHSNTKKKEKIKKKLTINYKIVCIFWSNFRCFCNIKIFLFFVIFKQRKFNQKCKKLCKIARHFLVYFFFFFFVNFSFLRYSKHSFFPILFDFFREHKGGIRTLISNTIN